MSGQFNPKYNIMKTIDITEQNKLIAEFIGVTPQKDSFGKPWFGAWDLSTAGLPFSPGAMGNGTSDLKFHSSWDWLMPVVEKIERDGFKSCIENHFCSFDGNSDETDGIWFENKNPASTKIDAVYQAVILFIEWRNIKK